MTNTPKDDTPPTKAEVTKAVEELEQMGLIQRTGEIRDGEPVFIATEHFTKH